MPHVCRMGYLLALLIGAALVAAMVWKPAPPARFAGLAGREVPRTVGEWMSGPDESVPAETQAALASASLTSRTYQPAADNTLPGAEPVSFVLIGGTDRSALHDPRSCLIGAGMQVTDDHLEALPGTGVQARACRAVGGPNSAGGYDMVYLYLVNGRVVNQATQIRAAMLWSALLGRRGTPVYFLRFTRPLETDPRQDARGHAALLQFATEMWTKIQPRLLSSSAEEEKGYANVQQNHSRQCRLS